MSEEFENKNVAMVALIIGGVVLLIGLVGLVVNIYTT
jgi:preprotein translocase subunit Sss1